jgi:hypothetical protein
MTYKEIENMQTKMETEARQIVADLRDKLAAAELHKVELEDQRDACAFNAHTGDGTAKSHLAKITKTLLEHDQQVLSLQAAIAEGERRVITAQGIAQDEQNRKNATAGLKLARVLRDDGAAAHKALRDAFTYFDNMRRTVTELNKLGFKHPSLGLVDVNLRRALVSASIGSGYALGMLPPTQRHTVADLGNGWAEGIQKAAELKLGEPEKAEAA